MRHRYYLADVFTNKIFGGNQLAIFPEGENIPPDTMQLIARELNLSETVFVLPPENPFYTRRLRIFTPRAELPFAGHPTIGTACVLASVGDVKLTDKLTQIVFEEGVGPIQVVIRSEKDKDSALFAKLTVAKLPEFGPEPPAISKLASLLSIEPDEILTGEDKPTAISCGVPFLFVPVRDRAVLRRVKLNRSVWEQVLAPFWAPHVYVFTDDVGLPGSSIRARMFAPAMGIVEDPATGAAVAALAGYLGVRNSNQDQVLRWVVEQGFEMERPSLLEVEAEKKDGVITAVRVGGQCIIVGEGVMEVPESDHSVAHI